MHTNLVKFSISSYAAWAPGIETEAAWQAWAHSDVITANKAEPAIKAMPALLRRRASLPGKMALEVAYRCLNEHDKIPIILCSRHGECGRSAELLSDLVCNIPISPTSFSLSVHNATGGLFSIARHAHTNCLALAAGLSTVEHAVIEACGLLADNEPAVLLVAYDSPLPPLFATFRDCHEQPYAWAWLIQPPTKDVISLAWSPTPDNPLLSLESKPAGLEILRFFIRNDLNLERVSNGQRWHWRRHVQTS